MSSPEEAAGPVLTQRMTMHLNGGSKYSEIHWEIYADGVPTGIRRSRRTSGRPKYLITDDVIYRGEEHLDVLATKGVGLRDWVLARLPVAGAPAPEPDEKGAPDAPRS